MIASRLVPVLILTLASLAAPAMAQSHRGVGLPLDSELLPPNSGPGDCVVRRVTGPGGAYRWDRVECDAQQGWSDHDQWGYGNRRLDIETRGEAAYGRYEGDRYGERRHASRYDRQVDQYEHQQARAYSDGYDQGRGAPAVSYPSPYAYGYVAAGRDEAGYLIWPGKTP